MITYNQRKGIGHKALSKQLIDPQWENASPIFRVGTVKSLYLQDKVRKN